MRELIEPIVAMTRTLSYATLDAVDVDLVLSATPIDLTRAMSPNKPMSRVRYDEEAGHDPLRDRYRPAG